MFLLETYAMTVLTTMSLIFSQIRVVLTPLDPRYSHKAFKALKEQNTQRLLIIRRLARCQRGWMGGTILEFHKINPQNITTACPQETGAATCLQLRKLHELKATIISGAPASWLLPFVSLAGFIITVGLVLRVLLVDTVVGQVHEFVTQGLHGRRIPEETKSKSEIGWFGLTSAYDCLLHKLQTFT